MAPKSNKREQETNIKRAPLNDRQLEMMLSVLLRRESLFEELRQSLSVETFPDHHRNYAIIWSIVNDYYDEFAELPDEDTIAGQLESRIDEDPEALSDEEIALADQFLANAFSRPESRLRERLARKQLQQYLDDRLANLVRKEFAGDLSTPENTFQLLAGLAETASGIGTASEGGLSAPFEDGWDEQGTLRLEKVSSDVSFLDSMLDGGPALGEVIGLLGPHGSCKTTLAMQVAANYSKRYYHQWREAGQIGPLKYVYVFIYEGTIPEMRLRILSYAAHIERTTLEQGDKRVLSRSKSLKPYELQKFAHIANSGGKIPCEYVRYRNAQKKMNHNLRIVDMTGNDRSAPGRGVGLVPEIAQIIKADQSSHRRKGIEAEVGFVVVDYAGAAVERHIAHNNLAHDRTLRHLISKFPLHCKNQIAVRYNTIVLCNHQLSGAANALAEGVVAKGTDAAESKNFRENADFLFVVSNLSLDGLAVINKDKSRRTARSSPRVIMLDGAFSHVKDTSDRYVFDSRRKKIVPRDSLHQLGEVNAEEDSLEYANSVPRRDSADDETSQVFGLG